MSKTKDNFEKKSKSPRSYQSNTSNVVRFVDERHRKTLAFKDRGLHEAILKRHNKQLYVNAVDVTPKSLASINLDDFLDDNSTNASAPILWGQFSDRFRRSFVNFAKQAELADQQSVSTLRGSIYTLDLDEIQNQIVNNMDIEIDADLNDEPEKNDIKVVAPTFVKITLRQTEDMVLFERNSTTVSHEQHDEAAKVNADNDYLTMWNAKKRRTKESETQTNIVLYKSRTVNTDLVKKSCVGTFVSNYDMFDTYADLARKTQSLDSLDKQAKIEITTYSLSGALDDPDEKLSKNSNFRLSSMVIERLLAGNVFREQQKRFRNMIMPDPLDLSVRYRYRLNVLWTNKMMETIGKAVSCFSWCHANSDLLAIGYGVYDFAPFADRNVGHVCVWSIKNPINPERRYRYKSPVTAVAFSRQTPQLMAVGLYNGYVEVIDITDETSATVGKSQRVTSPGLEPIWKIEWINVGNVEELLTVSDDGLVMKYTLANGPYLIGFRQIKLDRVEGSIEGLQIPKRTELLQANRNPQAILLQIHPLKSDTFFVGTDEGCLHKCSTFYPHQYAGIMQVHRGSVTAMEFSPWSPKIFLTCGSDWMIRIWIEDMYEPVMELSSGFQPIRSAFWSKNNSCIIACTTNTHVEIWNIRQNILKPAKKHTFGSGNIPLTVCSFTKCGRSLVVGDGEGSTHMCALEDMPFPPHFQYEELQSAIYHGLTTKPQLQRQVKSLGYLGYNQNDHQRS